MPNRITGIYSANDGGSYYVRFVGSEMGGQVFWFGEHPTGAFANVMVGELNVFPGRDFTVENGRWWDVPKGVATGASSLIGSSAHLELLIEGSGIRRSLDSGAGFGGSQWNKTGTRPSHGAVALSGFSGEGITGVWFGNDGGVYYIRQTGSEVAWFGETCVDPGAETTFANVFVGTLKRSDVTGSWADVPYGRATGSGVLSFRIEGDRLVRTAGAGFGGSEWTRSRISGSTIISALQITTTTGIKTRPRPNDNEGADDSRAGAVNFGIVELSGGRTLPKVNLNGGREIAAGQSITSIIPLPPGTRRDELVSFTLEHDGAPRNLGESYDNWDVGAVEIAFKLKDTACAGRLVRSSGEPGRPFVRLTGEKPTVKITIPRLV